MIHKILLGVLLTLIFYKMFYLPALMSTQLECKYIKEQGPIPLNCVIEGAYFPQEDKIYLRDKTDLRTYRHELVHKAQNKQHRLFPCDFKTGVFYNELEAYIMENFPVELMRLYGA